MCRYIGLFSHFSNAHIHNTSYLHSLQPAKQQKGWNWLKKRLFLLLINKSTKLCLDAAQHAMGLAWSNRRPGGLGGGNAARRVAPTLEALPLRAGAIPAAILASGSWSAVVLSEHGNRLETLQFPVRSSCFTRVLQIAAAASLLGVWHSGRQFVCITLTAKMPLHRA